MDDGITAEDIISIKTLCKAYKNKQGFAGTTEYRSDIENLNAIIEAGVTPAPVKTRTTMIKKCFTVFKQQLYTIT